MVKKSKDAEASNNLVGGGCICPIQNGCKVRQPIDPQNLPTDAVKVVCSNGEKCKQILYIHSSCYDTWSESLIKDYKALGNRARNDARMERFYAVNPDHIWGSHAYGKLSRFCKCPCGGTLKKNIEIDLGAVKPAAAGVSKKPKKPVLVMNKKFKGPSTKAYNALIGPTGFSNKSAVGINRLNHNSESSSHAGDEYDRKSSPDAPPYIPLGLYTFDAAGGDQNSRKVDNSVNVIGQKMKSNGVFDSSCKQRRPPNDRRCAMKPINTEDELLDELNLLFEQMPDDLSREQMTDTVNTILDRADVFILSTIADVGGIWEWLKQKADEEIESTDDDDDDDEEDEQDQNRSDADVECTTNDAEPWLETVDDHPPAGPKLAPRPSTQALVPDDLGNYIGFSAAFCYRESVAHVESLMKAMNLMTKH